jgi:SpoVK/Ycf46/Vps4 family AAA+-type ATPase
MKKKDILNLIKYHCEQNETGFRQQAYDIAKEFDTDPKDAPLAEYILGLLSSINTFMPQVNESDTVYFEKVGLDTELLALPDCIRDDILAIVRGIGHGTDANKFLLEGKPGTGKTQAVKQIARLLDRDLFVVNFDTLIDSKLGQTVKHITHMFAEIKNLQQPQKAIILFDEIDAIAIDRINRNDIREMGRATSAVLKGLDELPSKIVIIATTNLYNNFDKALMRRFDYNINFDRYSQSDLVEIGVTLVEYYLKRNKIKETNTKLVKKILSTANNLPLPGELKNIIKTSILFSEHSIPFDYIVRLYKILNQCNTIDTKKLNEDKFTLREIEILTGISKSSISRELQNSIMPPIRRTTNE